MFPFHSNLDTLYDCSLALCGDLLRTLERDEGELEVVRGLLKSILLPGLVTNSSVRESQNKNKEHGRGPAEGQQVS